MLGHGTCDSSQRSEEMLLFLHCMDELICVFLSYFSFFFVGGVTASHLGCELCFASL